MLSFVLCFTYMLVGFVYYDAMDVAWWAFV